MPGTFLAESETKTQKMKRHSRERQARKRAKGAADQGWYEGEDGTWNLLPNGYEVNDVYVAVRAHSWWKAVGGEE